MEVPWSREVSGGTSWAALPAVGSSGKGVELVWIFISKMSTHKLLIYKTPKSEVNKRMVTMPSTSPIRRKFVAA